MALIKASTAYPERSSIQRGERFSPKKFRFVFFVILHIVGIVSLVSCSWRKSGEGSGSPPAVYTRSASSILTDRAVLNGTVNPNGSAADAWFEYGTDPALPTWTATPRQAKQPVTTPISFRASIRGFSPYTTYYYRAVASSRFGTQRGDIQAFPTGEYYVAVGDSITLAAGKIPCLAKVPYTTSPSIDISSIREYNVVVDELVAANNISVTPPDFYAYFQKPRMKSPTGSTRIKSVMSPWRICGSSH